MTEYERFAFNWAVLCVAGPLGEARARRPKADGWQSLLSEERATAIHEASHAIAAEAVGRYAIELSIVPNEACRTPDGRYYLRGSCHWGSSDDDTDRPEPGSVCVRDCSKIAGLAWLLTPYTHAPRWKAVRNTVRQFRQVAESILAEHWLLILALANELERRKHMNRAEIKNYVAKVRTAGNALLDGCAEAADRVA